MKHRLPFTRSLCALALIMILTFGPCAPAQAGLLDWFLGEPEATEAASTRVVLPELTLAPAEAPDVPDSALEDDGWLRVNLKSMGQPEQLHLRLAGSYALENDPGFRFDRDTEITLTAADGEVWLSAGGLTIDMGGALTLTRHAAEGGENGLYIEESEKDTLYMGDLSVSAGGEGGLQSILKIQIEDYLCGVVGYEMSDSFPIEALKAQAVAARTYAMQRKWSAGTRAYDVVDTTADQVFKGYDGEFTHVIEAVEATRGIVAAYDGGFATCYYTASNGGQTALPSQVWGGQSSADAYLSMEDDPYDLENPRSLVNDLTFSPTCEGSTKLKQMLTAALGDVMRADGFDEGEWTFDAIEAIEPADPRFPGSRMYDSLAFDLRVKVAESALATPTPEPTEAPSALPETTEGPTATPEVTQAPAAPAPDRWVPAAHTYRVKLGVYDDIKDGLSMGLNGTDCELVSVETETGRDGEAESFRIMLRRYGHGVGMSQRGAQYMAGQYGKSCMDILKFYYPGVTFERMAWPEDKLTDLDALPSSVGAARPKPTARPTPAPLPALEEGEYYAKVTATSLNLREKPSTSARIVDSLASGRRLIVSGDPDDEGWVSVHTAEYSGYVKLEYLARE